MGKAHIRPSLRQKIQRRAQERCEYCKTRDVLQVATFHCDHCVPESLGGKTTFDNLAWACPYCDRCKWTYISAIDPLTSHTVPLFNPRKDSWETNFSWSEDELTVIPLSSVGRATRDALQLNRIKLIRIRANMKILGFHP